jgi:tRNA-dihydrouridine synthase B
MIKPLRIGPLTIDFPVVLAALAGFSDLSYRLICRSAGAPYCATEAMLDRQMLLDGKLRRKLIKLDDADHPLAGQIMGFDPEVMAKAAVVLRDMGFDVIDLNFACPVRKVVSKKRGGYLLSRPDIALETVRAVRAAVPDRPVTLKLRRSFTESDAEGAAFWEIARGAFDAGVAAIAVHARSVDQKYKGRADWGFLKRVKSEFADRTVLGSGDIMSAADALRMIRETGVDGVLAARGAIGNPWIIRQARDLAAGRAPFHPGLEEQRELMERHFELALGIYGQRRAAKLMRNFGIHYARLHPHPAKVRMAFVGIKSETDWRSVMVEHYGAPPPSISVPGAAAALSEADGAPGIILASASPRRRELLKRIVDDFRVVPSGVDEEPLRERNPVGYAVRAAIAKAETVGEQYPNALIIAADTLVCLENEIFGKPESRDEAREMLAKLSGRRHRVVTGFALHRKTGGRLLHGHETTWVTFRELTPEAIERYLDAVDCLDKAGAYAIQESGDALVEKIEGDFDNVVGLPVARIRDLFLEFDRLDQTAPQR